MTAYDPLKHHRQSLRLKGYDYSTGGAYLVTICTHGRICLFGDVTDAEIHLNDIGCMVASEWERLPGRFPAIDLDAFIVMPNHIHGIIVITEAISPGPVGAGDPAGAPLVGAHQRAGTPDALRWRPALTLGDVVGAFKSVTTLHYADGVRTQGWPPFHRRLWQRNYHEHIIRSEGALSRIRAYIHDNPARWHTDRENPAASPQTPDEPW